MGTAVSTGVLVVGYALAIPVCVRLVPVLREKRLRWFAVLQTGTALIVAGYVLRDRGAAAIVNAGFFAAFAVGWFVVPHRDPQAGNRTG